MPGSLPRDEIVELLESLWREQHLTMVIGTHDSAVARRAQRLATMKSGKLTVRQTAKRTS